MPDDVLIVLTAGDPGGGTALANAVALSTGCDPAAVRIDRCCRRCGSTNHGKPSVTVQTVGVPDGVPRVHIETSLSRTAGLVAVAVTDAAPLGLDIEHPDLVARAPLADTFLHRVELDALDPLPSSARDERLTRLWTVKEAVLKATGWGLNVDPAELAVTFTADGEAHGRAELTLWPFALALEGQPQITLLELPRGIVGAVAVLSTSPPRVRFATA